jgi:hypothetical protein
MKASFKLTTLRQNCNHRNWRFLGLQDPKKQVEDDTGMTVNTNFYCDVLRRLKVRNVRRKRPQKWQKQNLIIHHDNALIHRSFIVSQCLAQNNMTAVPHPPYSPNLAPCDFFLFPNLKLWMKGWRFDTTEETQEESQWVLDTIPKRDFQVCFQA